MTEFFKKDKGTSFQDIIWKCLESLREKASAEFRTPQKKMVIHSNWTEMVIEGDSRKEFCQLVEFMSDILGQEFDEDTYLKYEEIVSEIKTARDNLNKKEMNQEDFIVLKIDKMRELLRLIMIQLKKKDYMKGFGSIKTEETQEEVQEEDE